ncbi:MAG: hypothetical protein HRT89_18010, partial [Lentisphaeria bacterium]|nr:hypothetical protein [Lentisphaeria bacterium]
ILGQNVIWITAAQTQGTGAKLVTQIIRLRKAYIIGLEDDEGEEGEGAPNDDLVTALLGFLVDNPDNPADAKFEIYRNRGILIIRNTKENLKMAQEIIAAFDRDPLQVLIETRFKTLSKSQLKQLGVTIEKLQVSNAYENNNTINIDTKTPPLPTAIGDGPSFSMAGIIERYDYEILIEAIETKSLAKTLTAPRVTVINNQTAEIRRGDQMYYFDEFDVESTITDSEAVSVVVPQGEAKELELGITFKVRPSIANDGKSIIMEIESEITEFIEFVTFANDIQLPRTNENSIRTKVGVNSGQVVILGGQLASQSQDAESKVPFFGDIPLIGRFFRKTETSNNPEHLIIFIAATIIDFDGNSNITRDEDGKLKPQE